MPAHWYLLQTKRHKEAFVCRLLQSDGVRTYLPLVQVRPKNPRAAAEKPWFPGYVFVRLDPGKQSLSAVNWTPGTQGLVELAGEPAVVSDDLIRAIKSCITRHDPGEPHPTLTEAATIISEEEREAMQTLLFSLSEAAQEPPS